MVTAREQYKTESFKTVLVTGGAGYIGSVLCKQLIAAGYRVRVLDTMQHGDTAVRACLQECGCDVVKGDCRDTSTIAEAVAGVTDVVHLAGVVGDQACAEDPEKAISVNYGATSLLAQAARKSGVNRFLFASSCSTYGASECVVNEESPLNPLSVYALTKVAAEEAVLQLDGNDFHPVVLRFATVFGMSYRPRFDLLVNLLTARAYERGVITIFNGSQWRPLIHVQDVARALGTILSAGASNVRRQVFNVGDTRMNYTLRGIAEAVQRRLPNTRVEYVENKDRRDYRVSFAKIRQQIGFECSVKLDDGINELCVGMERRGVRVHEQRFHKREETGGGEDGKAFRADAQGATRVALSTPPSSVTACGSTTGSVCE